MDKLIQPFLNLANANMMALVRCFQTSMETPGPQGISQFWSDNMENQATFLREYSHELSALMKRNHLLMDGEMEKLSERSRNVASQLTHTAVRAVAIATQARHQRPERRVFTLPLPNERRAGADDDRRLSLPAQERYA